MVHRIRPPLARVPERAEPVDDLPQDAVGRSQVRDARGGYGWPSTAPGTPVFVEYLGWMRTSGRIACTAWETATAASA